MALTDTAVRDGGKLHILLAPVGTPDPTQAMLDTFDAAVGRITEVQTINLGAATAGSVTLTVDGQTTAAVAFNATAAAAQTALEALSNVAAGDIVVTGGPLPGTITLTFGGRFAGMNVAPLTVTPTGLTGGTVTVATTSSALWDPWTNLGHTDLEEDISVEEEGGESTVRGSRQNPSLRETVSAVTQFLTISSIQIDATTLTYYFGTDLTISAGVAATTGTFAAVERAALLVFVDGASITGVHYPKTSVRRGGPPSMASGSFRRLPIRITPLKMTGQPLQRWIDPAIVAA